MTLVMGILNVTPDSFSDGGKWDTARAAIEQGLALANDGADIIDVGGESTRPGAQRVDPEEEVRRVLPVVKALASEGLTVSIDTMRASTARAAIEAGASIVNDVSGALADPDMAAAVAQLDCDIVAMHWRAHSPEMDAHDVYDDVVADVHNELLQRVFALQDAGVATERIIVDPGLGFAKVGDSNWDLLAHLDVLRGMGQRILVGASRKRFVGAAIARDGEDPANPQARDHATTAITTLCAQQNVWAVRVHDARAARDAIQVVSAWQNARNREL
jgi:dihydropteroate synthase